MTFSKVPLESKNKINQAGKFLLNQNNYFTSEYESAIELAEKWRACHAYPINTFQATLRKKLSGFAGNPIVAQRLKRMPTIIDKLKRFPYMQLTTMQDIGGVRAILNSIKDVNNVIYNYKNNQNLLHELIDEKDYINNPRNEDGYRSCHLIYRYMNNKVPIYNGLKVELQIRTKLQHLWATAVETMGTMLGQALKSRQGEQKWLDFFAITSSAFAIIEKTPKIPKYSNFNKQETYEAVINAEADINALEKMEGITGAVNEIGKKIGKGKSGSYHLIVLNSLKHSVQIQAFDKGMLDEAVEAYSRYEELAIQGKEIEPVLVSAGPIKTIKNAYPNFFLDIREFVTQVKKIKNFY